MSPNFGGSSGVEKERTDVRARVCIGKYQWDTENLREEELQGCGLGDTR